MIDRDANTVPTLEKLAELIKGFQQDMTTRLDSLESEVKTGFSSLEAKGEELRLQMLSLETRHDRLASQVHEMGAYVYNHNADLRVLTTEVRAWAKDVMVLRQEVERSVR